MDSKKREPIQPETDETYRARVFSFIKGMIRNEVEAEDVLQDVYEEYLEIPELDEIDNVGGWLLQVARNKILDRFRRRKTEEQYQLLIYEGEKPAAELSPEDDFITLELREDLAAAIASLPEDQKEVFVLHELEGKSFEDIAEITGQKINTLLSRKRSAVLALRESLKEIYDELSK